MSAHSVPIMKDPMETPRNCPMTLQNVDTVNSCGVKLREPNRFHLPFASFRTVYAKTRLHNNGGADTSAKTDNVATGSVDEINVRCTTDTPTTDSTPSACSR